MISETVENRIRRIVDLVERADVSLPAFAAANELDLLLDQHGADVASAAPERDRRNILTRQLGPLVDGFEDAGVPFVVIKYPYLPKPLSDIDVLVDDPTAAHDALTATGFTVEDDTEPHRETYVKTVDDTRVAVDLHLAMSWRRVRYLATGAVLENRQTREIGGQSVPTPSLEHHLAITAAHSLFKHNSLSAFEVLEVVHGLRDFGADESAIETVAAGHNWRPQLKYFLRLVRETDARLLGEPARGGLAVAELPVHYPLGRIGWFRLRRAGADVASRQLESAAVAGFAYPLDVVQHVIEQRLGRSMKPLFDGISWIKRHHP